MKKPNLLFKFIRRTEPEVNGSENCNRNGSRVHPTNEASTSSNLPTLKTSNDSDRGPVSLEIPAPSISTHWGAARSVASSLALTKRIIDAGEHETAIPPSMGSGSKPHEVQGREGDEAMPGSSKTPSFKDVDKTIMMDKSRTASGMDEDAIKVKKRRLAKRQRKLNPQLPLHPLHNQHPFIRIDMGGDDSQATEFRTTRFKALRSCVSGILSKCLITREDTRNYVRNRWRSLMRKKVKWDTWNPDKNHPFVRWINESKIAGLKEAVKPNRSILYRIFWLTTFILLFGGGMKFSIDTYQFHKNSPVLFGFKTKEVPIENIPFPTVTISSFNSFKPSTVQQVDRIFWDTLENEATGHNDTNKNETSWNTKNAAFLAYYMDHICSSTSAIANTFYTNDVKGQFSHIPYDDYLQGSDITDAHGDTLKKQLASYIRKVSMKCEDVFKFCVWNLQRDAECKNHFRSVLTSHGGGCSFNHLPVDKLHRNNSSLGSAWERENPQPWKFEDWEKWSSGSYVLEEETSANESFPARQRFGGRPWGLTFLLKMEDTGDCPQFDGSGSRITISVPGTDFDVTKLNVAIPPKSEVFIKLTPELTTADEELRTITPERRGCYFPDEKRLAFYNKYSQENCHRECLANYTLSECKCTRLSFPNSAGQLMCKTKALDCVRGVEAKLYGHGTNRKCGECLPSCNQMTLREEVSFVPLSKNFLSDSPFKSSKDSSSLVHLFYGPSSVIAKERQLRHSKYELFSQISSIFETTNEVTVVGTTRTIASLYVFYPTLWSLLKLLVVFMFYGLKKWRSFLMLCCGNRRRVTVHNAPAPPVRLVNVIEVEDEEQIPNAVPHVNYEVFLARS